ncbi:hypothetical protein I8Y06_003771 [Photobacterium damselae]|nr:hypothetical protein [Photobacterium damselae]
MLMINHNKGSIYLAKFIDFFLLSIGIFNWLLISETEFHIYISSILMLSSCLLLVYKSRNNKCLLLFFVFFAYVNTSVIFSDILKVSVSLVENTLSWQSELRESIYNSILIDGFVVFITFLNFLLPTVFFKKAELVSCIPIQKKNNILIFSTLYLMCVIFWLVGYQTGRGDTYESVTSPLYEYILVIFPLLWYYAGTNKIKNYLLFVFVFLYVAKALSMGDRSSAIPMLILIFLICPIKLNLKRAVFSIFVGVLLINFIAIYRLDYNALNISEIITNELVKKSFTSDTVSQSYYTAVSIFSARDHYDMPIRYFGNFILGVLFGGWVPGADVINLSFKIHFNRAGGFYFSWFYFWFGFLGIFISALILSLIIKTFSQSLNSMMRLYQILLVVFFIRWYVYTPFVLFRSVLFIFGLLIIIASVVEFITKGKVGYLSQR